MDDIQHAILTWGGIILIAAYSINKFKGSLGFGSSFNPTDRAVLSTAWNDAPGSHAKYTYTMHADKASNISEDIYSALGAFEDNFTKAFTDLQQCKTQGDVFQVSILFKNNFDANLWESMVNGFGLFPWSGFSNDQLKQINDYVVSLPL